MSDSEGPTERNSPARNSLIAQAVLAVALIAALLALLVLSGKEGDADRHKDERPALTPRIGVAVGGSSSSAGASSLSPELSQAVQTAPDVTQTALNPTGAGPKPETEVPSVPEGTADVSLHISEHSASSRRPPAVAPAAPAPQHPASSSLAHSTKPVELELPPGVTGFTVQLGVFSNPGNAEALQKRLKRAGIPAQLETRVQVGPFKSKEEAARVQEKLKKIGMDAGMMVPLTKKAE